MKITNPSNFVAVFMVITEATRGRPIVLVYASVDSLLFGFVLRTSSEQHKVFVLNLVLDAEVRVISLEVLGFTQL